MNRGAAVAVKGKGSADGSSRWRDERDGQAGDRRDYRGRWLPRAPSTHAGAGPATRNAVAQTADCADKAAR